MTHRAPADTVQANILTFVPFGNPNRDEEGHPKTMTVCNILRGRFSPQSQKAALRSSSHLGPTGCGIRSRNLAIETFERLGKEGVPERLSFAAAEIVRAGLGNGQLRTPRDSIEAVVAALLNARKDWRDTVTTAFPQIKLKAAKGAKKGDTQGDESAEAEEGMNVPALKAAIADMFSPKETGLSYRIGKGAEASWPASWAVGGGVFAALSGSDEDLSKNLMTAFQADQPLLFSTQEIRWKDDIEHGVIEAWRTGGPAAVGTKLESVAPGGKVQSPMPKEAIDVDIALFGRMVPSMPEATVEAALSIDHSMTVGEFQIEADFFTAGEDRPRDGNDKVGHMGHSFWGTGIHHRYIAIDMNLLRANLAKGGRAPSDAAEVAERAMAAATVAFATTLPRGKSANSATFSPASFVMIERGGAPATNLSVAFARVISPDSRDPMAAAIGQLREYKEALTRVYGSGQVVEVCAHPGAGVIPGAAPSLAAALVAVSR